MAKELHRGVMWKFEDSKIRFNDAQKQVFLNSADTDEDGLKSLSDNYHKNNHIKYLFFKPDYENLSNYFFYQTLNFRKIIQYF